MSWISFITGGVTSLFLYALFTSSESGGEEDREEEGREGDSMTVNTSAGRFVTMSCQTCRKLKKHKEVQSNLYQCVRCKRHTDLRAS
jgi:acetyl-CoA carboxylase beta subunit